MRRRWPAATAPASTSAPAASVSDPVAIERRRRAGSTDRRPPQARRRRGCRRRWAARPSRRAAACPCRDRSARTVAICMCGACSSRPGLATIVKFSPSVRHAMSRRLATLQVDIAAEHVDADRVADLHAPAAREVGVERDERRPVVVRRPPRPGDEPRAVRLCRRRRSGRDRRAAPTRVSRQSHAPGRPARRSPRRCARAGWALPSDRSCPAWRRRSAGTAPSDRSGYRRRRSSARSAGHLVDDLVAGCCPRSARPTRASRGRGRARPA